MIVTAANLTPELATADRRSLLNACSKCASDGLLPDGREAALVMFSNKVQYMPMVAGVIKRLRQSGEISAVTARLVYEKELEAGLFRYVVEDGVEKLSHAPMLLGDRGKPALVYATARLKDGTIQNEVMTVAEVEKIRAISRAANSGPWKDHWGEMARKTVIRRLSKYLPFSAEDRRIFSDNHEDAEFEEVKGPPQPQSIAHAAAALSAPASTAVDGETGEVIDGESSGSPTPQREEGGQADQDAPPPTITKIEVPTTTDGEPIWKSWHALVMPAIGLLSAGEAAAWRAAHQGELAGIEKASRKLAAEIEAALKAAETA